MNVIRRTVVAVAVSLLVAGGALVATANPASAHGALLIPGSRTYLCWLDGLRENGQIIPFNPACAAAVQQSGTTPLYNWFAVLDSNAGGRTQGYIPNGTICSAGNNSPYNFAPYNAARNDWPATRLTSGGSIQMRYNNWAHHPGTFNLYITRNGWNQNAPLTWADLEPSPFFSITNPQQSGPPGGLNYYIFGNVQLPSGKSGRHIIFSHWIRSDSAENFYGCSDVIFDGGNGQLVGVGSGGGGGGGGGTPPPPPPPPPPGNCTATGAVQTEWSGGYVMQPVTVTNTGTGSTNGWSVTFTVPAGHQVTGQWNASFSVSGQTVTATNLSYNGALAPGANTSFGFQVSRPGGNTATPSGFTCSA